MAIAQPLAAAAPAYAHSMEFFKSSLIKAQRAALLDASPLNEQQEVRVRPRFETACWNFKGDTHYIFVGDGLFNKPNIRAGLPEDLQHEYVAVHYRHELGHGLYTMRNLEALNRVLTEHKIPFGLFNLFEDARIEHLYRTAAEFQFGWLRFEELDLSLRPLSLLFALIQSEGDVELVREQAAALHAKEVAKLSADANTSSDSLNALIEAHAEEVKNPFERVLLYYQKAIGAPTSMGLLPTMKAWLKEFPEPPPDPSQPQSGQGKGQGMQDMSESMQMAITPGALEAALEASEGLTESEPVKDGGAGKGSTGVDIAEAAQGQVLQSPEDTCESDRVPAAIAHAVALRLMPLFRARHGKVSTMTPQRKVSARHFGIGRPPFRKKVTEVRKPKNLLVVVDCSGSMSGFPMEEGKKLLAALSVLAEQGHVKGHVVFSGVMRRNAVWERYTLPLAPATIARAKGRHNAEGLYHAIKANLQAAKQADHVLVYTDASICDSPMDKESLHVQGVYTWGVYCGAQDEHTLNALQVHFDKALMRPTVEALVDAILAQV